MAGSRREAWRLVLSTGAKALLSVFLVLGALVIIGSIALGIAGGSSPGVQTRLNAVAAAVAVESSYSTLSTSLVTFKSKTTACHGQLSCVTAQDTLAAQAFGAFAQALHTTSMPSGSATAAAAKLNSDATQAQTDFLQLAKSTSVSQYQQTIASTALDQRLAQFDTDYRSLGRALGVG